jgi:hypothetical protein
MTMIWCRTTYYPNVYDRENSTQKTQASVDGEEKVNKLALVRPESRMKNI